MEYYGNEEKMSETIIFLLITIKKKKKEIIEKLCLSRFFSIIRVEISIRSDGCETM